MYLHSFRLSLSSSLSSCPNCKYRFQRSGEQTCKFKRELGHREDGMARDSRGNFRRVAESRERVRQRRKIRKDSSEFIVPSCAKETTPRPAISRIVIPAEISQTSVPRTMKTDTITTRVELRISSFPTSVSPINTLRFPYGSSLKFRLTDRSDRVRQNSSFVFSNVKTRRLARNIKQCCTVK